MPTCATVSAAGFTLLLSIGAAQAQSQGAAANPAGTASGDQTSQSLRQLHGTEANGQVNGLMPGSRAMTGAQALEAARRQVNKSNLAEPSSPVAAQRQKQQLDSPAAPPSTTGGTAPVPATGR
ncbi:hypothetical protein [Jiella sp. M17.18]|uniref:hypothetical protein n=1 Tax=Jiella sp. M17.18 TaxID=3234247 RepID=UPI0034DF74B8